VYLASASAVALRDVSELALVQGDERLGHEARAAAERAIQRIATGFWDETRGTLAHSILQDGTRSKELTVWPAVAVAWKIVGGPHALSTMNAIGADELTTKWGVRFLSSRSQFFDPQGYNQGAVWPFVTGLAALGDFEVGRAQAGFDKLAVVARLTTSEALGRAPEILSGTRERTLDASVPHQLFSSMACVAPLVQGLFGYEPDALHEKVVLRPCFPESWGERTVSIRGLRFGAQRLDLSLARRGGRYEVQCTASGAAPAIELAPRN
jgi:glycogen debranching enzyme